MVDVNNHDTDKRTKKVSSHVLLLFFQHLLLLTRVILLLDCCAVDLTFEQTVRRRAVVPVDVVVRELRIFRALQREAAVFNALLGARRQRPPEEELGQTGNICIGELRSRRSAPLSTRSGTARGRSRTTTCRRFRRRS